MKRNGTKGAVSGEWSFEHWGRTPIRGRPEPYHIVLASLMNREIEKSRDSKAKYVPHTLTPNFDDLLFDAFYLYLEDKPQLINHRAIAPEFKLTRNRPTIVKLHGDYLYDNLQNTDDETNTLETELREILDQVVHEYGLVVVGYGGYDESIMEPLLNADIEYGIYWCTRDPENLSPMTEQLLKRSNTFLVPIKSFESLMSQFANQIDDIELPTRDELVNRAEQRADQLDGALQIREEVATDEEEEEFVEKSSLKSQAVEAGRNEEYQKAIDLANQLRALDPDDADSYFISGLAKHDLDQVQAAVEDYDQAIELDPENAQVYNNRGITKLDTDEYQAAIDDFDRAIELDPDYILAYQNRAEAKICINEFESARQDADAAKVRSDSAENSAVSILLYLISAITLGAEVREEEAEYRKLCSKEFAVKWPFDQLESWVASADLETGKKGKIRELIELLGEHKSE